MNRAEEQVVNLINYGKVSQISLLKPPKVEKGQIPTFITCPSYAKAKLGVERTMERFNSKVADLKQRLASSDENIESLKAARRKVDPGKGYFVDTKNPEAVDKYNNRLEATRRLQDKIDDAIDKHNDLVEKHNGAIEEAKQQLEELEAKALLAIDDDIVAVLDKCTKIAEKFSGSANTEELVAAIEICLLELRIFAAFEGMIDGNDARKACRDRNAEVQRLYGALCGNEHVRNYLADMYRRNAHLVQKNKEIYEQVKRVVGSVDQKQLNLQIGSVAAALAPKFDTKFAYEGVVDPAKLEAVVVNIRNTIAEMERSVTACNEVSASTAAPAQAAVDAHQGAVAFLSTMRGNVDGMRKDLLSRGHFACEMIDEAVIDDFFHKDLRPAVASLRQHLIGAVSEEQVDVLVLTDDDLHSLAKTEKAVAEAGLVRLQSERDKIDEFVKQLTGLIRGAEGDIAKAGEVPQQNANALQRELDSKYMLACVPGLGTVFGFLVLSRVGAFEAAFRSPNPIYRALGTRLLGKNDKMTRTTMILGVVVGLVVGVATYFGTGAVGTALAGAGAILCLYVITGVTLSSAGKRLRSYMGTPEASPSAALPAGG